MRPFPRTILYAVAGVLVIALISSALTMIVMNRTSGDRVVMSAEEYSEFSQIAALDDVMDSIEKEYYAEVPSREKMIAGAANGMLDTLDDPYARYYTAEEYEEYLAAINGEYYGIGLLVGQPNETGSEVLEVYQGSTSESAGIKVGDIITAVNGTSVANMDQDDLRALIDAKKADGVQLSILRGSETLDITVTGGNITVKHVDSALFNDRTGYIYVSMFTGNCADEFENAIKDLKSRNMKSLVIDLRNNPGGSLDIVVRVGEILLGKGMRIVSVGPTDSTEETVYNGKGSAIGVPVAVIVNENSASASEILAAAIQENEIGVVVGINTYGKGVVQTTSYIESTGGWLKITTDAYYTPNGNNINGVGISPDILMELPEQYHRMAIPELVKNHQKEDTQLWEALDYVRERANEVS